jgi:NTP pyrophosphatase (non-canonical NTP hydrolase)
MTNKKVIDSDKYVEFVRQTTSPASSDFTQLLARMTELETTHCANVPRLLTAALGVSAESGELVEIIKKVFLQGKPYTEETKIHILKEFSDVMWYLAQLCIAMDMTFEEIMKINYEKLSARYPEGTFNVYHSENRAEGDI